MIKSREHFVAILFLTLVTTLFKLEANEPEARDENGFTKSDYQWWAVQPVKDVTPPEQGEGWSKNPIDQFIAARLSKAGLKPAQSADRYELVRRAYFDLHGLPPTPEQVESFVTDTNPDAFSRLIDQLLASPHYGERWGQHWLDVVRYSESDGYRADDYRPDSWQYRDYVIRSFNQDKPYDQFIKEQLAADELAPDDPDKLIGTAFLRLGIYEWNQRNARMQWDLIMTEMTNATADAFLGIGIGCAQCHDHKFDPIKQKDFFALQAFLNTTWWPDKHPVGTAEQKSEYQEKYTEWQSKTADIQAAMEVMQKPTLNGRIRGVVKQFPDDIQEIYRKPTEQRNAHEEQLAQLVQRQVDRAMKKNNWEETFAKNPDAWAKYQKLEADLKSFAHLKPKELPRGFVSTDIKPQSAGTFMSTRKGKELVEPAFLSLLDQPLPRIEPKQTTTGRRTALANWIADQNNPLSTRVITNRVWQYHFGKGLAPSPNDFGKLGGKPTHPELLDWLTVHFIDGGWSINQLHKLIMTSATYQQTARREPGEAESQVDPGNELLWRFSPKRLSAEQVRDSMLVVSGELDRTLGGKAQSAASKKRAIYTQKKRNRPDPLLAGFDAPSGFASEPDRVSTTTPNQSLMLVNGTWPMDRAKAMATHLLGNSQAITKAMIEKAYLTDYGRIASDDEIDGASAFIEEIGRQAVISPVKPDAKSPKENGLCDINQHFSAVKGNIGRDALWLQPGSRFQQLDISGLKIPADQFTIETVARLETLYQDGAVNTLVSKWNGNSQVEGWALGVTSEKSRYQPKNFIMQLVGDNFQGNRVYEVVASNLRVPLNRPVYLAAVVSAQPTDGDANAGKVTFYMQNLADLNAKLSKADVPHRIVGGLAPANLKTYIGGRNGKGHLWEGQMANLRISSEALKEDQLLIHSLSGKAKSKVKVPLIADWDFSTQDGEQPAPGTKWFRRAESPSSPPLLKAMTDFCHALLNSNEFLYLH